MVYGGGKVVCGVFGSDWIMLKICYDFRVVRVRKCERVKKRCVIHLWTLIGWWFATHMRFWHVIHDDEIFNLDSIDCWEPSTFRYFQKTWWELVFFFVLDGIHPYNDKFYDFMYIL